MATELTDPRLAAFAKELRKWWSFDDCQIHTHSWHTREDFIEQKLPKLLETYAAQRLESLSQVTEEEVLVAAIAHAKATCCGFTIEGERTLCCDARANVGIRHHRADCDCLTGTRAALEAAKKART